MVSFFARMRSWWRRTRGRERLPALSDLVEPDGFVFRARLDLDVPLAVLRLHETRVAGDAPPADAPQERFGRYEPAYRVLRVGGYARDERHGSHEPASIDTPVGPMPRGGGAFLRFLLGARAIAESAAPRAQRLERLRAFAASDPEFTRFAAKLGDGFAERMVDAC